jgi:hypothetical protein
MTFTEWLDEFVNLLEPALSDFEEGFSSRILHLQNGQTILAQGGVRYAADTPRMRLHVDEFCELASTLRPRVIGAEIDTVGWVSESIALHIEETFGPVPAIVWADRLARFEHAAFSVDAMFVSDGITFVTTGRADVELDLAVIDETLEGDAELEEAAHLAAVRAAAKRALMSTDWQQARGPQTRERVVKHALEGEPLLDPSHIESVLAHAEQMDQEERVEAAVVDALERISDGEDRTSAATTAAEQRDIDAAIVQDALVRRILGSRRRRRG